MSERQWKLLASAVIVAIIPLSALAWYYFHAWTHSLMESI